MKFSESDTVDGLAVAAYESGCIRIGGTDYRRSLIVSPGRLIPDWAPQSPDQLRAEDLTAVLQLDPEIVVLGTGPTQCFPDPALYSSVMRRRVGMEIMDTGAACRTYNILMSEGRRVVAALIIL